ncbi:MAG: F0F1 ATP synthase subunit gamma [Alphaproteobacteria bacterium]
MPSLKDLKNRIASVQSTQKITRAMQMVSAAKLRRAQERAESARPYSDRIERVLANLASTMKDDPSAPRLLVGTGSDDVHLLIVATADRGLCGAFNTNIVRAARARADELLAAGKTVKILCVGKKGRDILKRLYGQYILDTVDFSGVRSVGFEQAQAIGRRVMEMFDKGEFDVCTIFYSEFVNVMSQKPTSRRLIPASVGEDEEFDGPDLQGAVYEYEPDEESIVATLLPLNLSAQLFRALLENGAGEQGARMAAMDNATRNAGELIDKLTLQFNRTRQANITRELIEIVSGAEAL